MDAYQNWKEEKNSVYLYEVIAGYEKNPEYKKLFQELAKVADNQAGIWEKEILQSKKTLAQFKPDFRTRLVAWLVKPFGPKKLRFILSAMKVRGMAVYNDAPPETNQFIPASHAEFEKRHKSTAASGNLRAAVFGINDGLISNMSLILGIAGASYNVKFIVLSGIAGLLAGASSMAAGEYISVRSQRELYENQIELERDELTLYPEEEATELAYIYKARGIPENEAHNIANLIISNPEKALDTLSREELGINPHDLSSPWGAAIASFSSFAIGAFIPLFPFLLGNFHINLIVSLILTAIALFSVGAILSLYTNRNAFYSGFRMLGIGVLAGCATFFIGKLVGLVF